MPTSDESQTYPRAAIRQYFAGLDMWLRRALDWETRRLGYQFPSNIRAYLLTDALYDEVRRVIAYV